MTTGLRITEAASILKDSIDMKALELRVTGKGDKRRTVPLLPQTAEALKSYMRKRRSESPYLFPGDTSTGHMNIHNLEKTLRRMCMGLGARPFTPHQLRHLYATHMIRNGMRTKEIAEMRGVSEATINRHREKIRHKLKITNQDVNLATFLESTMWGGKQKVTD